MTRHMRLFLLLAPVALLAFASCGPTTKTSSAKKNGAKLAPDTEWTDPESFLPNGVKASATSPKEALSNPDAPLIAITNGTVMTAAGEVFAPGIVVLKGGAIEAVGKMRTPPDGAQVIDATGRFVTPGLIDTHSHIGVYSSPNVASHQDGNEAVGPVTPYARAEYGYWPGDPAITRARAGGVTTALVLPGSANLIGGRGASVIMRPGVKGEDVMFPGAPATIKMACGENPKRVYGEKGGPQTRMGLYAKFRETFHKGAAYAAKKARYKVSRKKWQARRQKAQSMSGKKPPAEAAPEPPAIDLGLETIAGIINGDVLVQIHCYRSDELRQMVAIADEFGFKIRSFHHALEAYKVRDVLIKHGTSISTWADWWGFKMEAFDGIPENAALYTESGGRTVIHSDSSIGIQRLNQEAGKAMWSGRNAGIAITDDQALRWVTSNPAWVLGLSAVIGSLEVGKRADVVVWNRSPFSVYSRADLVVQGGEVTFRRESGVAPTDFELGNSTFGGEVTR